MIRPAIASICETQSERFKGLCLGSDHYNCNLICKEEGFKHGKCSHLTRRCKCTKDCGVSSHTPTEPGEDYPSGDVPLQQDPSTGDYNSSPSI